MPPWAASAVETHNDRAAAPSRVPRGCGLPAQGCHRGASADGATTCCPSGAYLQWRRENAHFFSAEYVWLRGDENRKGGINKGDGGPPPVARPMPGGHSAWTRNPRRLTEKLTVCVPT